MLVGNVGFTELGIAVQEKLEPDGNLVKDEEFERMRGGGSAPLVCLSFSL